MADNDRPVSVGDIVRYKHGRALYAVTATAEDNATLIDLATGAPWGTVLSHRLVLVASYDELYERRRADG